MGKMRKTKKKTEKEINYSTGKINYKHYVLAAKEINFRFSLNITKKSSRFS